MSESASQRSGDASETSSQAADRAILKRRNRGRHNEDGDEDDLLEQKKSLQEGIFSAMYMLSRSKSIDSWKFATVKIVLEGLIPFLVIFNPTNNWDINTSNPMWQIVRWALPRSPVARIWGYDVYIRIFYVIVVVVYIAVVCIGILTLAMRRQEHSKMLKRFAKFLQFFTEVVFTLAYMAVFDFMIFLFNCKFSASAGYPHAYWSEVHCFETPHLIHMAVAGVTSVVFFCSTGLMLVAGCDLNPIANGIMASPTAVTRLRVLVLKAIYVVAVNTLASALKVQAVLIAAAAAAITYFNFTRLPFLRYYVNFYWVGGWMAVTYTCVIYCIFMFNKNRRDHDVGHEMVQLVLYGVFPAIFFGMVLTAAWFWHRMSPRKKFVNIELAAKLKKIHGFGSPEDVEVLARTMRHFDTDGVILEESVLVGETVIKCGMAVFPNNVELLVLNANFLMEVKRDGPAARTQLQLALKGGPSLVQRYEIFSTIENSKRLKDGQEGQLDLQSYVEFKRNYRAVMRVHKAALTAQRDFWQLMLRTSVRVSAIECMLTEMDEKADTAHQVYKRVLERYPNNGKLLRCYGKFLEDVRNDPIAATRAYTEAARNGGGDGLLSLDLQIQGSDKPEFLTTMDLHEDACIVINAEGTILMVNSCVTTLLGYPKTELENANVSMIMPQPFSGRHASYLTRYVQGGEPHILDTVRDVVALHKDRYVFPLQLCVTKLSGLGTDAIFMGVLRPQPMDARNVRAWVAPNGIILCTDPQFASLTGMLSDEMVGCNFQTLCTDMGGVESLLEICKDAPYDALVSGTIVKDVNLVHKHLPPVPVEIKVTPGGTDSQRIFVFNAHRVDGMTDGLMVVDSKGSLTFATWDVAAMLGYPLKKFLKMKMEQLLPPPYATMHTKHLREHPVIIPPTSCRAGRLVHLVNSNGAMVPVRLQISTQDDTTNGHTKHIVQVRKIDTSASNTFNDKRLVLLCTMEGRILSVDQPESSLFGFTSSAAVGSNLADCIDVFAEWRTKAGAHQLELLLLSLLDREMEMPGTSWRVKVHSPETDDSLPNIDPKAGPRHAVGRSACLQSEIVDSAEHSDLSADTTSSLARIVLWRRDLLTGVMELDEKLVVRKADVSTGLIVGLPPSSLLRMPLSKLLDIPKGISWDELMKDKKKKSALKGSTGLVVSPQHAFEGPHPDGGTMRIFIQGVSGPGTSRVYVTFHPDTTFTGARANIYRALGLEALISAQAAAKDHAPAEPRAAQANLAAHAADAQEKAQGRGKSKAQDKPEIQAAGAVDKAAAAAEKPPAPEAEKDEEEWPERDNASIGEKSGDVSIGSDDDGSAGPPEAEEGNAEDGDTGHLHKAAHNQSEFVTQWVRTLAKQMTGMQDPAAEHDVIPPSRAVSRRPSLAQGRGSTEAEDAEGPEAAAEPGGRPLQAVGGGSKRGYSDGAHWAAKGRGATMTRGSRKKIELAPVAEERSGDGAGGDGDDDEDDEDEDENLLSKNAKGAGGVAQMAASDGASSAGDDDEGTSQGLGQAFTDASSGVDVDLATDARRARLLKRLFKLYSGPQLAGPLIRMRYHTWGLLAAMLVTHVVIYVIFISMINGQFTNVREVHRLALAADRCQLVTTKAALAEFCTRPGVTPVSVCEIPLSKSISDMRSALDDLEVYHQSTYLGPSAVPRKIKEPTAFTIWTSPTSIYKTYFDTDPPMWNNQTSGVWQMGNRFIATGRELLFWAGELQGRIADLRAYKFIIANGPWAVFAGYSSSLDYLVNYAWEEVSAVQHALIIMLAVEAAGLQLACILYELYLIRKVEQARGGSLLTGLGIPGPMLRVLASKPVVVVEDSDDDEGEEEGQGDGGGGEGGGGGGEGGGGGGGGGGEGDNVTGHRAAGTTRYRRMSMDMAPPEPGVQSRNDDGMQNQDSGFSDSSQQHHMDSGLRAGLGAQSGRVPLLDSGGRGVIIGARRGANSGVRINRGGRATVNGKELVPSYRNTLKFMLPLLLWEAGLIVIGAISYLRLEGMQGPLASLNMASHVIYRYTRIRATALLLVTSLSASEMSYYRDTLKVELTNIQSEYDTLMYGGLAVTQEGSVFQRPVPASTFESTSFSFNFFKEERCFRWDQTNCYTTDSPYYEVTHHGLDVMLRRIISEMNLLASDDDVDAVYNGTRYTTMYMVGTKDLYEGLQSSAQLFVDFSISRYNSIKLLQTILLVCTIIFFVLYALLVLRPYGAAVEKEAGRLAGLMSHVPAEMDVSTHVRQVLRAHTKLTRGDKAVVARQSDAGGVDKTAVLLDNLPPSGKV